jgi:ubiquinone/menaquinone biosynthesis C-methylase UbiE
VNFSNNIYTSHARYLSEPGLSYSECLACKTVFLNPMPTKEQLSSFYVSKQTEDAVDDTVKSSAMRVLEKNRKQYFQENRVNPLLKYLSPEATVFDVGCGVGAFVYALKEAGISNIQGCDLSKVSIKAGREVLGLEEEIFQGDIHSIPDKKFELITLWTVIEHLLDPEEFLIYIKENRLKKNGYVLVEFPTTDSLMFEYLGEYFKWIMPPYHLNVFSKQGMEKMLGRCGYQVVETHSMPLNWYFFESVSKKIGLSDGQIDSLQQIAPGLSFEIDKIFDEISLQQKKSSSIWMLATCI